MISRPQINALFVAFTGVPMPPAGLRKNSPPGKAEGEGSRRDYCATRLFRGGIGAAREGALDGAQPGADVVPAAILRLFRQKAHEALEQSDHRGIGYRFEGILVSHVSLPAPLCLGAGQLPRGSLS